ncbi:exocyst complex component 6, putative, partial [Acanthamoeba castellanii str. Neff]
ETVYKAPESVAQEKEDKKRRRKKEATTPRGRGAAKGSEASRPTTRQESEDDEDVGIFQRVGVTFTPVYKCIHIYENLSSLTEFENYYQYTRQGPAGPAFLASRRAYESYFYQITGFFIVEAHVWHTTQNLISPSTVKGWWETAAHRIRAALQEQVTTYCRDVVVLQQLRDFVFLFTRTISAYGYDVTLMQDFFKNMRDKYIDLATQSYREEFLTVMERETFQPLYIADEEEYQLMILDNNLDQIFPHQLRLPMKFPFCAFVPNCVSIVKHFIKTYYEFSKDLFADTDEFVKKGTELLLKVMCSTISKQMMDSSNSNVSSLVQLSLSLPYMKNCCNIFEAYIASFKYELNLIIIIIHMIEQRLLIYLGAEASPLSRSMFDALRENAEKRMFEVIDRKIDELFDNVDINWAAAKSEFKLFAYDPLQSYKCISATVLQGPSTLTGQHHGVVCDGCQRYAFRGQRYLCSDPVCREYNLCHTCQQLGVTNKQHQKDHAMDVIAEPQPANAVPALAPQCLASGYFFTTGHQLGVLLPPGVPPNTLRRGKMMCRVFNMRQGRHVSDLMVENGHNGQCICYDRKNNLLWMHSSETSSVLHWTHLGKTSPSPGNRPDEPLSEGDEDAAAAVTATLAGPSTASAGSFVISSLLQVLAANVQHLIQVLSPEEASKSFGLVLLDIRDLVLRLALGRVLPQPTTTTTTTTTAPVSQTGEKRPGDKTHDRVVQADARRCLLVGLPIFYPTHDKQVQFLHELLAILQVEEEKTSLATEGQTPHHTAHSHLPSPARLLLDDLLEKLSQELALGLGDMLFAPILSEVEATGAQRKERGAADAEPSSTAEAMDRAVVTSESSEKLVRDLIELAVGLMKKSSEDAKVRKTRMEQEVRSLLLDTEGSPVGPTAAEEARTIYNVLLAVQRDLLSSIGFSPSIESSGEEEEEPAIAESGEVKRLLRWTSLMIQKSIEMVGLVLPRSALREGEATIKPDDQIRAHYFVVRLGALRDSLFGVVLPPLVTSLYHFADRPDFVDVLPALLQLLWELDEMNKFFVASKAAFKNLHLAQEADKQKRRQEAAAIAQLAAIEASRTPSTKDRKARASLPEAEDEVEAPVSYPFAWLLELEKTLGTVCGMLSSSLMAGTPETSQERPYLSHLRSDLFSAGLEDSEDEALVDASATEGMDVDEGASKTAPQGDFFKRLMAVDESDDELGPLVKWISAAGPRLPIPAQAEKAVASAVRGTFAAVVKHANLEPQLVEWASQLRTAAQKRMDLDAKEGDSDDTRDRQAPRPLAQAKRGTHYADRLEGCSRSSILAVRQSFAELFRFLLRSLAGQEEGTNVSREAEQLKFHTLVLNALALDYRMFDYALFSNSDFHAVLHKLSTHDVALRQEPSSSSSSSSSTANPAPEAVAASKLRAHKKRVVRVARDLFLLSAARCLAWTPTPLTLKNNHLGEDEAQQILDLQDAVLRTIFFTELGSHRREEEAASEAMRSSDLDDDYHHSLLALLYQLKRTATMQRFFSSSESIHNLLSLLKLGSPRVQRLVTRLPDAS